jgi:hypothetical protein
LVFTTSPRFYPEIWYLFDRASLNIDNQLDATVTVDATVTELQFLRFQATGRQQRGCIISQAVNTV